MSEKERQDRAAPRVLLLCSAAFFLFCALCTALLGFFGLWKALLLSAAAGCTLAVPPLLLRAGRWRAVSVGLLLGMLCCTGHAVLRWQPADALKGREAACRIAVTERAVGYGSYGVAWGELLEADGRRLRVPVKVFLADGSPDYQPGDLLTLEGVVREASHSPRAGMIQRGVWITVRQQGTIFCAPLGADRLLLRLRRFADVIRAQAQQMLPGAEGGLLTAMLTGETGDCPDALLNDLNAAGLRHITAVSGLHLTILSGFLIRLLGKRAGSWVALPVVFAYAAIAGFPASAVRAAIMQAFLLAAFLLKKDDDSPTALGASLLLLCAAQPGASLSAGLMLSFSATAGILWASPAMLAQMRPRALRSALLDRPLFYLCNTWSVSLAAAAFTLPITLVWFGSASMLSLPMNLLSLWAVSFALLLGIAGLLVSAAFPAARAVCGRVAGWPLRYLTAVVGVAGRQRWAATTMGLYGILLAAGLLLLVAVLRKKRPLSVTALCAGLLLLLAGASAFESRAVTRVAVGDGGGGAVIALRSGGETAYIGAGASGRSASAFIRSEQDRAGRSGSAFLLTTGGGWRQIGGLREAVAAAEPEALLLPAGTQAGGVLGAQWYTGSGQRTVGRLTAAVRPAGDGSLCLVSGAGISLLDLSGAAPWAAVAALSDADWPADVLLMNDAWLDAPEALRRIIRACGARMLLLADDGWGTPARSCAGLPMTALSESGTVVFESVGK